MQDVKKEQDFDLKLLLKVLLRFWYIVLIVAIVFAAATGGYKMIASQPLYRASVSFWVSSDGGTSSNTMGAAQMATGYVELINSGPKLLWDRANTYQQDKDPSAKTLNDKWGISINNTYAALGSMVRATKSSEESLMFTVTVTSLDINRTYDAIFSVQYVTESVIAEISGVANVIRVSEVFDTSDVTVVSDSPLKFALLGAVIGAVVAYVCCFFYYINRRKIDCADMLEGSGSSRVICNVPMLSEAEDGLPLAQIPHKTKRALNLLRSTLCEYGGKTFAVASVSEKSSPDFICSGLAASFIQSGKKCAVVSDTELDIEGVFCKTVDGGGGTLSAAALTDAISELQESYDAILVNLRSCSALDDPNSVFCATDGVVVAVYKGDSLTDVERVVKGIESANGKTAGLCYVE